MINELKKFQWTRTQQFFKTYVLGKKMSIQKKLIKREKNVNHKPKYGH